MSGFFNNNGSVLRAANLVNVLDYGAVADGSTDDSAAVLAARNAANASGAAVYFPRYVNGNVAQYNIAQNLSGADVRFVGDPGGTIFDAPASRSGGVLATGLNVNMTEDMIGPHTVTEIVTSEGFDHITTAVDSITLDSGNEAQYDHGLIRLERSDSDDFTLIVDGTDLTEGFDCTLYHYSTGTGDCIIQGDGVTTVSVDGGAADAANTVTLADDRAAFIKIVSGVVTITTLEQDGTTPINPVISGKDCVTRVELSDIDEAELYAFNDVMKLNCNLEADCTTASNKVYRAAGEQVYGRMLNYVFLTKKLKHNLDAASQKYARKFPDYKVHLENIIISYNGNTEGGEDSTQVGAIISGVREPQIINCGAEDTINPAWRINNCFAGVVDGMRYSGMRNIGELGEVPYVLVFDGWSAYFDVVNMRGDGARHVFDTTTTSGVTSYSNDNDDAARQGELIGVRVRNCYFRNGSGSAGDTHNVGEDGEFDNCVFDGCNRSRYGTIFPKQIQHRAGDWVWRNCIFRNFIDCIAMDIEEERNLPHLYLFENNIFEGSVAANGNSSPQRGVHITGGPDHGDTTANAGAIQRIVFRGNTFRGSYDRLFDMAGNYHVEVIDNDFEAVITSGGYLIELDGGSFTTIRNKLTVRGNRFDTNYFAATHNGIVRVNGTIDVEIGDNEVRGSSYNAFLYAYSDTDIQVVKNGVIKQVDARNKPFLSGDVQGFSDVSYDGDVTGWEDNVDGVYTSGSPLNLVADTDTVFPNARSSVVNHQLPVDVEALYAPASLAYDALTEDFIAGDVVTGGSSGATATILKVSKDGTAGRLFLNTITGTFTDNETITGAIKGSADADGSNDTGRILGSYGDAFTITIDANVAPVSGSPTYLEWWVDIGGAVGVLYKRIITFPKGGTIERPFNFTVKVYALDTWELNGAEMYVRSDGVVALYDIRTIIFRDHKGRPQ